MKTLLLILSVATLAACSTAYKSGQTPDDVYFSKPKVVVESTTKYEKPVETYEDRSLRMAIHDPRWRNLDYRYDYDCSYNPYSYGYNYGYYYNPYYYPYPVYANSVKFINPKNTTIRTANLGAYTNTITTNSYTKGSNTPKVIKIRNYNNNNSEPTRTYNDNNSNNNTRTYSPSTPSSSSGSTSPSPAQSSTNTRPNRGG
ncbi:MAG: hypothetical protein ABL929_08750 [Ferruginibacter sp.]|nr:hypothetical protein [Ferruginibacter sp.]